MNGSYVRRVVDDELDALFAGLPAIAIEGARGVGKTATALQRATTTFRLDDPVQREIVSADLARITTSAPPILIDEWQWVPASWDAVRRAVDDDRSPGRFLLTGSRSPLPGGTHTGAGRIVRLRMRPMTLAERGVDRPTVSLRVMLAGGDPLIEGSTDVTLERYVAEIVGSGYPGIQGIDTRSREAQLDGYLTALVDRDFAELGREIRNPTALMRWLRAYAAAVATTTSYEKIRDAAAAGPGETPTRATSQRYLDTLERLWIVEPIPAWSPIGSHLSRLAASPKHQFADTALVARLLGVSASALLSGERDGPIFQRDTSLLGALFESLVAAEVRVYAQAAGGVVSHLRSRDGDHEVDLIVQDKSGRIIAIEVKLSQTVDDADVRHLRWLRDRIGPALLDAVVVTTGPYAYRRADGIAVVPASLLGP